MGAGGSIALSVLMIPVVVRSSEEMLKLVPNELREAAYALGVPRWRTIVKVVIPTAIAGIATGITLAIARVIGETAPLLIICGLTTSMNTNLFEGRMTTLPVFAYYSYVTPGLPPRRATSEHGRRHCADRDRDAAQPGGPDHLFLLRPKTSRR
jgi:phosphate transport system permease protein